MCICAFSICAFVHLCVWYLGFGAWQSAVRSWHSLDLVCARWIDAVFRSPNLCYVHLNLLNVDAGQDVLRGCLVFDSMAGFVRCLQTIRNASHITVRRVKNRFSNPTIGGYVVWVLCMPVPNVLTPMPMPMPIPPYILRCVVSLSTFVHASDMQVARLSPKLVF